MKKYFPILKGKSGDIKSLKHLEPKVKSEISPIIELLPNHISQVEGLLIKNWNFPGNEILIDCSYININIKELRQFFRSLATAEVNFIPVIELGQNAKYIDLVGELINTYDCHVCIRIKNHFSEPKLFNSEIEDYKRELKLKWNKTIILFDLGYTTGSNYQHLANSVITNIQGLNNFAKWKQILVAAGSFPVNLTQIDADTRKELNRYEWVIWSLIQKEEIGDLVSYSDYGIKHPIFIESENKYSGSSSIKYTTENSFLIYRGKLPSKSKIGTQQYNVKSSELIKDDLFDGDKFSWADNEIYKCGNRSDKPGNQETWVIISQNRHISKIHSML